MKISRKEFVQGMVATGLASVVAGCGSSGGSDSSPTPTPSPTPPPNCLANGTTFLITSNHGHTINVTVADIQAGVPKTYDIMGSATHSHSVTLTAADFTALAANTNATELSTSAGHTHNVTIICV